MYGPQKVTIGSYFVLRIPYDKGGPGNSSAPIGINAFRTTNFWSLSAMRGTEFHWDTRRDTTTRILSISKLSYPHADSRSVDIQRKNVQSLYSLVFALFNRRSETDQDVTSQSHVTLLPSWLYN